MLQLKKFAKFALITTLLAICVEARALQQLPIPGVASDLVMEAGCADCDLNLQSARIPAAIDALAEVSESEEFRNQTIFDEDDRVQVSRDQVNEYTPIGMLENKINGMGVTATLVDECHILTVAHVLDSTVDVKRPDISQKLVFHVGPSSASKPFAKSISATPVSHGRYIKSIGNASEDWMLLRLSECAGREYGTIPIDPINYLEAAAKGTGLEIAGFPRDRDFRRHITVDPQCRVGGSGPYWGHNCAALTGNSGSGIFYRNANGKLRLIMIHSQAIDSTVVQTAFNETNAGEAAPVRNFFSKIASVLTGNGTQLAVDLHRAAPSAN